MKEIEKYWNMFISEMVETHPTYTDNDFTFNNFMDWYGSLPDYSDGKGHSIDVDGNCNRGCC